MEREGSCKTIAANYAAQFKETPDWKISFTNIALDSNSNAELQLR